MPAISTTPSRKRYFDEKEVLLVAASIDSNVFIARRPCKLTNVNFVVTATAAGATVDLKKCTGTTAPASGTTMLASVIALDTTANTVTSKALSTTASSLVLNTGDRIAADLSGTLTGLSAVVSFTVEYL